ncbi:MAG: hypothetical protein H7Y36_09450 [Armatimonadetes bacterium]|nr:hypothetical protein [Akkermansiaceae bacterium]
MRTAQGQQKAIPFRQVCPFRTQRLSENPRKMLDARSLTHNIAQEGNSGGIVTVTNNSLLTMRTTIRPLFAAAIIPVIVVTMLLFQSCATVPTNQSPRKGVKFIPIPRNVVAVLGEAEAFETPPGLDSSQPVLLDLTPILKNVKNVEAIDLLQWSGKNTFTRVETEKRKKNFYARLKPQQKYIVLGIVSQRARDTYAFICRLRHFQPSGDGRRIPEICKRILCGNESMLVDAALTEYPELDKSPELRSLKGRTIGGIGNPLTPGACEICTSTGVPLPSDEPLITPGLECIGHSRSSGSLTFVFARKMPNGAFQIFKSVDGTEMNLSNNGFSDQFPDVSFAGNNKISFISTGRGTDLDGIYTMNLDGTGQTLVHKSARTLSRTCWAGDRLIAFTDVSSHPSINVIDVQNQLFNGVVQATSPNNHQSDNFGHDFLPSHKNIVFSRSDRDENDFDLFMDDFSNASVPPITRLTHTPQVSEEFPVVSHNDQLMAFRELIFATGDPTHPTSEQIKIVRPPSPDQPNLNQIVGQITLAAPAGMGITGLDFTTDDTGLLVAVKSIDVTANDALGMQEIFFIKLDGTGQRRLTTNANQDSDPRALPASP